MKTHLRRSLWFLVIMILVLTARWVRAAEPPVVIPLVTQMNQVPTQLNIPNWKQLSLNYYQFLFNPNVTGFNGLPAVQVVGTNFGFADFMDTNEYSGAPNGVYPNGEAMTCLAPVIGAEMLGMNMTNYEGLNWVQSCKRWFNTNDGPHTAIWENTAGQTGDTYLNAAIYAYWPMALGEMLTYHHQNDTNFNQYMSMQSATVLYMAQQFGCPTNPNFNLNNVYNASAGQVQDPDFVTVDNGDWAPGNSACLGWMLYMGYLWTGSTNTNYLACAQSALQWYNNNPGRGENTHQYGPLTVARLNAEQGMNLDLGRMMDNFFGDQNRMPSFITVPDEPLFPLTFWSISAGWSPGGLQMDGLDYTAFPTSSSYGFAFPMGCYQNVAWLAPVARYDQRFAASIGKLLFNDANSSRFEVGIDLSWQQQDHLNWKTNLVYQGTNEGFGFSYEAVGANSFWPFNGTNITPYAYGTPLPDEFTTGADYWKSKTNKYTPAPYYGYFESNCQDIALYQGNSIGFMGALDNTSSVPAIIGWDLTLSDYFHATNYPSYLFYNPYSTATNVTFNFGGTNRDIYDTVSGVFLMRNVNGSTNFTMGPTQAMVLVEAATNGAVTYVAQPPPNGTVNYDLNKMLVNGVVVNYRSSSNGLMGEYCNNTNVDNPTLTRIDGQVNFNWGSGAPAPGISSNNYSVRWTGTVVPQYSQTYTLSTETGDGVRLWVNGQMLINHWVNGVQSNTCQVALTANVPAQIRMEVYKGPNSAQAQFYWTSSSQSSGLIASSQLSPASGNGLQGEYYASTGLTNLATVRPDPTVNFNWGTGSPDPLVLSNSWSVLWTGWLVPRFNDLHTLTVVSSGGMRLWLDGRLVIDNLNASGLTTNSCTNLFWANQPVQVKLECKHGASTNQAQMAWVCPSQPETEIIPPDRWFLQNTNTEATPGVPGGLAGKPSGVNQVSLSWGGVNGASAYDVYRATSVGGPYTLIATVGVISYIDSSATNGVTYYYEVSAINLTGQSALSSPVSVVPGVPLSSDVLDQVYDGTPVAAYSLRQLTATYTGPAIQVRRDSDNTTTNIGFTSGLLNTNSLMNFVGTANGFVVTWYDQSGNGYNAVDTISQSEQPLIVSNGVLSTLNGRPALLFTNEDWLGSTFNVNQPYTMSWVAKVSTVLQYQSFFEGTPIEGSGPIVPGTLEDMANAGQLETYSGVSFIYKTGLAAGASMYVDVTANGANTLVSYDGQTSTGNAGTNSLQGLNIFNYTGGVSMAELMVFGVPLSTNDRLTLESNQSSAYLFSTNSAPIVWGVATGITGDANLSTNGTYVDALIPDTGATNLTVDGVTFHVATSKGGNVYGDSVITFNGSGLNNYSYPGTFPIGGPASTNFATLMGEGGVYQNGGSGSGTVTISNLTVGATYQVQIFNYAPGTGDRGLTTMSGSPSVTLSIRNGDGGTNTYGEFATGTFTANASTETFNWNGAGSSYTVLGDISVRKMNIVWNVATGITGDTNLLTNGTYVDALIPDTGATNLTVDGVTFNVATSKGGNVYGDSVITFNGSGLNNYSYPGTFPVGGGASTNFATLMGEGGVYQNGGSGSGTVTISGLTVGATYQVQIFNYAPGTGDRGLTTMSGSPSVTLSIRNGDGGTNTYGEFATGTFTATTNFQTFNWNGAGSSYTVLGDISVRKSSSGFSSVVIAPAAPQITGISLNGTALTISGAGGPANGTYYLLMSTNLALPISQWTPVLTNQFDSSGNLNMTTNTVQSGNAQEFFILEVPQFEVPQ